MFDRWTTNKYAFIKKLAFLKYAYFNRDKADLIVWSSIYK